MAELIPDPPDRHLNEQSEEISILPSPCHLLPFADQFNDDP
jgi:hypothetical protein